jgi:hypothetical protein
MNAMNAAEPAESHDLIRRIVTAGEDIANIPGRSPGWFVPGIR